MCSHSGALKRFSGISAEHTIRILIVVYVITFLINFIVFLYLVSIYTAIFNY